MATVKRVVDVDLVPNTNEKSDQFGKYYGRIHYEEPINLRGLCEHIVGHGSLFTRDVVDGVAIRMRDCIIELVSTGVGVKIDGLGTFRPTLENAKGGVSNPEDFNCAKDIVGVHVRFIPENASLDRITSRAFAENCILRKSYVVSFKTITHKGKQVQIPVYTPIISEDPTP